VTRRAERAGGGVGQDPFGVGDDGKAHALLELLAERGFRPEVETLITAATDELIDVIGARRACALTSRCRASYYRNLNGAILGAPAPRCSPLNKLSDAEPEELLALLQAPEFVDLAPAQVWAIFPWLTTRTALRRDEMAVGLLYYGLSWVTMSDQVETFAIIYTFSGGESGQSSECLPSSLPRLWP
jgi:hypothetical protein